jgi:putative transposase
MIKTKGSGDCMLINKAYKFRLYPNNEQKFLINKTLGCARLIYNHFLNEKINDYKENKQTKTAYDLIKEIPSLKADKPFLKEVDSISLRTAIFDLNDSYDRFFKKQNSFPKFKNKFQKNSYRTDNVNNNIKIDLLNKLITLPKLKKITLRGYRNLTKLDGRIINATVYKKPDNRYYVSVLVEQEIEIQKEANEQIIGIDLGIKDLMVTSEGEFIENPKALKKYEKRLVKEQRKLSKKVKRSNNYYKQKQKLATIYRKIKNTRKYYIHKITKTITDTKTIITTETLKVVNMLKNHKLAKSLSDVSFGEIIRQLKYKSLWKGKRFYQIETFYPSSQICSSCNYQNKETKDLNIRNWTCPECKTEHNRDLNAAFNIEFRGLELFMEEVYG